MEKANIIIGTEEFFSTLNPTIGSNEILLIYGSRKFKFGHQSYNKALFYGGSEGDSENRPNEIGIGFQYFDTTLKKPIWWNGSAWIDKDGNPADAKQSGATADRPTGVKVGYIYKDTTLGKLIIWDGSAWKNMDGSALS